MMSKPNFLESELTLNLRQTAAGDLQLPASKSISIRAMLLASMGKGSVTIKNTLISEDTLVMRDILIELGVSVKFLAESSNGSEFSSNGICIISGCDGFFPGLGQNRRITLNVKNSGLSARTILPSLAFMLLNPRANCSVSIDGVERMRSRPMSELFSVLESLGSKILFPKQKSSFPCELAPSVGRKITEIGIDCSKSSQVLTGLLQILPFLNSIFSKKIKLLALGAIVSRPYIDLTMHVLSKFGCSVAETLPGQFYTSALGVRSPKNFIVEGDASSASYFFASACIGGGPIRVHGISEDSKQGDVKLLDVLKKIGAEVRWGNSYVEIFRKGRLRGVEIDCLEIPDAAMVLSTLALFCDQPTKLINIASWKEKETDRITAVVQGLERLGGSVYREGDDAITIHPVTCLKSAKIQTFNDHRIAMTFSMAAFALKGEVGRVTNRVLQIENPECVEKTFPYFFEEFSRVCSESVPVITVDGPTASGKGTIANHVGRNLGFNVLDSGAFYRSLALITRWEKIDEDNHRAIAFRARTLPLRMKGSRFFLGDDDVTVLMRDEKIGLLASKIAKYEDVRRALIMAQRDFARLPGLVADGRDMGSVVFPRGTLRVFLTAKPEIRAKRRFKQLIEKEIPCTLNDIFQDIIDRDNSDYNRPVASLALAEEGATLKIDSSSKTVEEVVKIIVSEYKSLS
ncbi:MAG: 3-phosphoshikimate 1-carboxyvinyltransferase [Burkholderiaceae bacterium]|nr:MAG: 3-phosphoshikimate 1-carboxyvinyltransferase [Burkholderiaceae bacterium]